MWTYILVIFEKIAHELRFIYSQNSKFHISICVRKAIQFKNNSIISVKMRHLDVRNTLLF